MKLILTTIIILMCLTCCDSNAKKDEGFSFAETMHCYRECMKEAPLALEKLKFTNDEVSNIDIRTICRRLCISLSDVKAYSREK